MGKLCFGVDLGGTTVKMGVFTVEGSLLSDWEIPTRKEEKGKYILDDIAESIKAKIEEERAKLEKYTDMMRQVQERLAQLRK